MLTLSLKLSCPSVVYEKKLCITRDLFFFFFKKNPWHLDFHSADNLAPYFSKGNEALCTYAFLPSFFFFYFFMNYLGILHHESCYAHLPVFLCSPLFPCDCLHPEKSTPPPNKSILCGPYVYQSMVKFLVALSAREDESFSICICSRSHHLRRAIRWPEQTLTLLQATVPITGLWIWVWV